MKIEINLETVIYWACAAAILENKGGYYLDKKEKNFLNWLKDVAVAEEKPDETVEAPPLRVVTESYKPEKPKPSSVRIIKESDNKPEN